MTEIPTFSECVIGYRQWRVDDWVLSPLSVGKPWRPGVNHARCQQNPFVIHLGYAEPAMQEHKAPHQECACGIYAYHDPDGLVSGAGVVLGAIAAWGDLQVHHGGFRAEHAQIVALVDGDMGAAGDLTEIAKFYGVPLIGRDLLTMEAERHGQPLPVDVRPDKPEPSGLMQGGYVWYGGNSWAPGVVYTTTANVTWGNPFGVTPKLSRAERRERRKANRQGPHSWHQRPPKRIDPKGGI